jgi:phosphoribosylanthranilate isomerase
MLKYPVYVRNISNLSDARYSAGMGVELLGFCFDEHVAMSINEYEAIKGWVSGVKFVAEFHESSLEYIKKIIQSIQPDFILLDASKHLWKSEIEIPIIFKLNLDDAVRHFPSSNALVLLYSNESQRKLSEHNGLIKELVLDHQYKIFLSYGFNPQNLEETFARYMPFGISLVGENEIEPGLKNFDHLSEILEALEL